jgi:hypothetical protein
MTPMTPMTGTMRVRERMARNFIKNRGRAAFRTLLSLLEKQESGQVIGDMLGVSRERVRQWRNAFGETVTLYRVYPEVQRCLPGLYQPRDPREGGP